VASRRDVALAKVRDHLNPCPLRNHRRFANLESRGDVPPQIIHAPAIVKNGLAMQPDQRNRIQRQPVPAAGRDQRFRIKFA
jgi:hypothetical protein